jgi:hypothetical protein
MKIAVGEGHSHQQTLIVLSVIADFCVRAGPQAYRRLSYGLTLNHVLMQERQPQMMGLHNGHRRCTGSGLRPAWLCRWETPRQVRFIDTGAALL